MNFMTFRHCIYFICMAFLLSSCHTQARNPCPMTYQIVDALKRQTGMLTLGGSLIFSSTNLNATLFLLRNQSEFAIGPSHLMSKKTKPGVNYEVSAQLILENDWLYRWFCFTCTDQFPSSSRKNCYHQKGVLCNRDMALQACSEEAADSCVQLDNNGSTHCSLDCATDHIIGRSPTLNSCSEKASGVWKADSECFMRNSGEQAKFHSFQKENISQARGLDDATDVYNHNGLYTLSAIADGILESAYLSSASSNRRGQIVCYILYSRPDGHVENETLRSSGFGNETGTVWELNEALYEELKKAAHIGIVFAIPGQQAEKHVEVFSEEPWEYKLFQTDGPIFVALNYSSYLLQDMPALQWPGGRTIKYDLHLSFLVSNGLNGSAAAIIEKTLTLQEGHNHGPTLRDRKRTHGVVGVCLFILAAVYFLLAAITTVLVCIGCIVKTRKRKNTLKYDGKGDM